jgi:hypothetical protein
MKEKKYSLLGEVVVSFWGGGTGAAMLEIETDERGLKEIRENPLQDYTSFGVESIDYARFDVYLTEIETKEESVIKQEYLYPVEEIQAGELTPKIKEVIEKLYEDEPAPIKVFY